MTDPWISVPLGGLVLVLVIALLRGARRHDLHVEIDWHSTDRVGRDRSDDDGATGER